MNLNDIKEQFKQQLIHSWERIQETSIYHHIKDRYENLSPQKQKWTLIGIAIVFAFFTLNFPYTYLTESHSSIVQFEERRDLIRRLLKVSRESSEIPNIPMAPPPETLRSEFTNKLESMNLMPDQIRSIDLTNGDSQLIPGNLSQGGVTVNLMKLNLRQVVDIGHQLSSVSPSIKMNTLKLSLNREDTRYLDAAIGFISLAVPQITPPAPAEEEPPAKPAPRKRSSRNSDDS